MPGINADPFGFYTRRQPGAAVPPAAPPPPPEGAGAGVGYGYTDPSGRWHPEGEQTADPMASTRAALAEGAATAQQVQATAANPLPAPESPALAALNAQVQPQAFDPGTGWAATQRRAADTSGIGQRVGSPAVRALMAQAGGRLY